MLTLLLVFAAGFLAYANGANDNFKGVASLLGSRVCSYRTAVSWATVATLAGSLAAVFVAEGLLERFSGQGLVPPHLVASPAFVLSVAFGAGSTVLLAALLGFPISTTHALTGALVGGGWAAAGQGIQFEVLGKAFVLPLLVSPLLAAVLGAMVYMALRFSRLRLGVTKEMCLCGGIEAGAFPQPQPDGVLAAAARPVLSLAVAEPAVCAQRYTGLVFGIDAGRLLDALHFLSAGAVSFARGLNDTPKIAALLLVAGALPVKGVFAALAAAMAAGGLLSARKVAETMSHRITAMNPDQGFAANLSTALLVSTASFNGLPVSTTHVSVGSLLGMGAVTRQVKWKPVLGVLASWVVTLPCGALMAALSYLGPQAFS